jgi:hypothetical protein
VSSIRRARLPPPVTPTAASIRDAFRAARSEGERRRRWALYVVGDGVPRLPAARVADHGFLAVGDDQATPGGVDPPRRASGRPRLVRDMVVSLSFRPAPVRPPTHAGGLRDARTQATTAVLRPAAASRDR